MTKEFRRLINRARQAQDKVFNGKAGNRISIHVEMGTRAGFCDISAFLHAEELPDVVKHHRVDIKPWSTAEEIEEGFKKLSHVVGFDI